MFKELLLKKMLAVQLKGVPQDQQEKILAMVERNPKLFQTIAEEMQTKIKGGKDQMAAAMEVMRTHQQEIQDAMRYTSL